RGKEPLVELQHLVACAPARPLQSLDHPRDPRAVPLLGARQLLVQPREVHLEVAALAGAACQAAETPEALSGDGGTYVLPVGAQAAPEPAERHAIVVEGFGSGAVHETGSGGLGRR